MTGSAVTLRHHGNAYNIFILVLTVLSLAMMAAMLLPLDPQVLETLRFYDNLVCLVFLADFAYNLAGSRPRREYVVHRRGWLDLLGSIPTFGVFPYTALLRLFRLSRLARIGRILGGQDKKQLLEDVVRNRNQYAFYITILLVIVVLTVSSVLVLQFELASPEANITTGGNALWWAVVTITTVGYGDHYPVTFLGRATAVVVMFAGVGIIGALASLLANLLISPGALPADDAPPEPGAIDAIPAGGGPGGAAAEMGVATAVAAMDATFAAADLQATRTELATTRAELAQTREDLAEIRRQLAALVARLAPPRHDDADTG
jgi:voltage-gated potassium channel